VLVLHCYSGNMYGGVEAMLATLARGRDLAPGLDQEFALCHDGRLADELRDAGATVHRLGPARFSRPWTILEGRRRLRRVLAASRPDAVACHSCWPHALFGPVARRAGLPLAFWAHDVPTGAHWIERRAMRTPPDLALANSRFTAAALDRLFPASPRAVLYCPVGPPSPSREREATRRDLGAAAGDVVILQASRLERWKGQSVLVEALGRLRGRPGWAAWIAGGAQRPYEAAYLEELRAAAHAAGVADRVRFLGHRSDVPALLAAADLFCQPNTGPEPFGIALVEALYAGLPVVGTALGGAAEVVDATCGVHVPPDDPAALADALATLIDDPAARARLGAAGPPRARALSDPAAALRRLSDLLAGLAGARAVPA
jgi:glycosyltransferase involved in cell wall biosynthesis